MALKNYFRGFHTCYETPNHFDKIRRKHTNLNFYDVRGYTWEHDTPGRKNFLSASISPISQQRQLQAASAQEAVTAPVAQPAKVNESLINLKLEELNAKANTQSIKTADEVLGTLIDIKV